jgi:hypothetical protein
MSIFSQEIFHKRDERNSRPCCLINTYWIYFKKKILSWIFYDPIKAIQLLLLFKKRIKNVIFNSDNAFLHNKKYYAMYFIFITKNFIFNVDNAFYIIKNITQYTLFYIYR